MAPIPAIFLQLAGMQATGNPLLDMYSQYAAAAYSPQVWQPIL